MVRTINSYNVRHRIPQLYETNFVFNYINSDFINLWNSVSIKLQELMILMVEKTALFLGKDEKITIRVVIEGSKEGVSGFLLCQNEITGFVNF